MGPSETSSIPFLSALCSEYADCLNRSTSSGQEEPVGASPLTSDRTSSKSRKSLWLSRSSGNDVNTGAVCDFILKCLRINRNCLPI